MHGTESRYNEPRFNKILARYKRAQSRNANNSFVYMQMFITEIAHNRKFWALKLIIPRYNEHFACFPKNSLNQGF